MAAIVSFLCAGLQALDAGRIGAASYAVMSGVSWGAWAGSLTAFVTGLLLVLWLRSAERDAGLRTRAALSLALGMVTGRA